MIGWYKNKFLQQTTICSLCIRFPKVKAQYPNAANFTKLKRKTNQEIFKEFYDKYA
jgi:hypothetical protein